MEQFVLGLLQEQLGKYIVGFRKEMVNASLLNGKGEITDLSLNCAAINQQLSNVIPFIELDSIHISKVAFQVTSWTNLRKAPIMVDIEHITVHISEPLHYLYTRKRRRIRQMTVAEMEDHFRGLAAHAKATKTPFSNPNIRGGYNLLDRILDNLTIEIKSVYVQFQTWGKFKTRRPGPWTPPTIQFMLRNLRYVSVDEFGQEGSPNDVWSHNHKPQPKGQERTLLIFKKVSMDYDFGVRVFQDKGGSGDAGGKDGDHGNINNNDNGSNKNSEHDDDNHQDDDGFKHYSLLKGGRGCRPERTPPPTAAQATNNDNNDNLKQPAGSPTAAETVAALAETTGPVTIEVTAEKEKAAETVAALAATVIPSVQAFWQTKKKSSQMEAEPEQKQTEPPPLRQKQQRQPDQPDAITKESKSNETSKEILQETKTSATAKETPTNNIAPVVNQQSAPNDAKQDANSEETEDNKKVDAKPATMNIKSTPVVGSANIDPPVDDFNNKIVVQIAMKRRIRDGALLAIQVDSTLSKVEVLIPAEVVPFLVHAAVGLQYCFCKDRGYEDPLRSKGDRSDHNDASFRNVDDNTRIAASSRGEKGMDEKPQQRDTDKVMERTSSSTSLHAGEAEGFTAVVTNDTKTTDAEIDTDVSIVKNRVNGGLEKTGTAPNDEFGNSQIETPNLPTMPTMTSSTTSVASGLDNMSITGDGLSVLEETVVDGTDNDTLDGSTVSQLQLPVDEPKSFSKSFSSLFARKSVTTANTLDKTAAATQPAANSTVKSTPSKRGDGDAKDRAIIMIPNGLVIHEKISFSVSIDRATVRGMYPSPQASKDKNSSPYEESKETSPTVDEELDSSHRFENNDYIQVDSNGAVLEMIWPKSDRKKGGYAQASVSHMSVQERVGRRIRTIVSGGVREDPLSSPVEKLARPPQELKADESFPVYQDRAIREDPLDLRRTFPAQAFGLISTIDCQARKKSKPKTSINMRLPTTITTNNNMDSIDIAIGAGTIMKDPDRELVSIAEESKIAAEYAFSVERINDRIFSETQAVVFGKTPPTAVTKTAESDKADAIAETATEGTEIDSSSVRIEEALTNGDPIKTETKTLALDKDAGASLGEVNGAKEDAGDPGEAFVKVPNNEEAGFAATETELPGGAPAFAVGQEKIHDENIAEAFHGVEPEEAVNVIMLSSDVGIDRFNVMVDCDSWCRVLRFLLNESGGGFDARWFSGDWAQFLTTDMLVHPNTPLELEEHLQQSKKFYLDENEFISSDLLCVNARMTNCELCVPAAIEQNIRSCDIVVKVDESLLRVSSELPRAFLSGSIGNAAYDDSPTAELANPVFPNDPSDISVELERADDPARRQSFLMKDDTKEIVKSRSTFRLEVKVRGLSTQIVPVIPFYAPVEPQHLCAPTEMAMSFCFEGEPPETEDSNLIKLVLHSSIIVDRIKMNCDMDLLASAVSTCLHHFHAVKETMECAKALIPVIGSTEEDISLSNNDGIEDDLSSTNSRMIQKSLHGRRVLVHRQFHRSRETGGLRIACYFSVESYSFALWRQNVSMYSPIRPTDAGLVDAVDRRKLHYPLLKLLEVVTNRVEVGLEISFREQNRRVVLKSSIGEARMSLCNFNQLCGRVESDSLFGALDERSGQEEESDIQGKQSLMEDETSEDGSHPIVDLFCFGRDVPLDLLTTNEKTEEPCQRAQSMLLRCEEQFGPNRSRSFAVDMGTGGILNLHIDQLESICLLILEALMMPTWSRTAFAPEMAQKRFPEKSVGALFLSLLPSSGGRFRGFFRLFRKAIALALPDDLRLLLLRARMGGILLLVPEAKGNYATTLTTKKCAVMLHHCDLTTWYIAPRDEFHRELLSVFAMDNSPWNSFIAEESVGLNHRIRARQSLNVLQAVGNMIEEFSVVELVPEFEVNLECLHGKVISSMESPISFHDLQRLRDCVHFLKRFAQRSLAIFLHLRGRLTMLRRQQNLTGEAKSADGRHTSKTSNPIGAACSDIEVSIIAAKNLLASMCKLFDDTTRDHLVALQQKNAELDQLRLQVFRKERERIGAVTLAASPVAGWLRMGGTHRSGQRVATTSTLWRYWSVLRKDLLIFYPAPGKYKPVDIVCLRGAQLRVLAGGRSKWDLKRAFGIVEEGGKTRFIVAETEDEYIKWTGEIDKIVLYHQSLEVEKGSSTVVDNDVIQQTSSDRDEESVGVDSTGLKTIDSEQFDQGVATEKSVSKGSFRGKLAGIGSALKLSKQDSPKNAIGFTSAAATETTLSHVDTFEEGTAVTIFTSEQESSTSSKVEQTETIPSVSTDPSTGGSGRRLQLRGKVSGVSQATNRWGSALLAATKKKGREVAEKARRGGQNTSPSSKEDNFDSPADNTLHVISEKEERTWTCPQCTFVNSIRDSDIDFVVCAICENPTEVASLDFESPLSRTEDSTLSELAGTTVTSDMDVPSDKPVDTNVSESDEAPMRDRLGSADSDKGVFRRSQSSDLLGFRDRLDSGGSDKILYRRSQSSENAGGYVEEDETGSIVSDLAMEETSEAARNAAARRGRDRLGSFGVSLGNVRRSRQNQSENKGWLARLGSNLSSKDDNENLTNSNSLKLKNVRIDSSSEFLPEESSPLVNVPLRRFDGHWFVLVRVLTSPHLTQEIGLPTTPGRHYASAASLKGEETERLTGGQYNKPPESQLDGSTFSLPQDSDLNGSASWKQDAGSESEQLGKISENATAEPQSTPEAVSPSEASFCIQLFHTSSSEDCKQPRVEVLRNLSEVVNLHTLISESIVDLSYHPLFLERSSERTFANEMSDGLMNSLGVSPLDTVRVTGALLAGVLDATTGTPPIEVPSSHIADVVMEFLNSTLECPLPGSSLLTLANFLRISTMPSHDVWSTSDKNDVDDMDHEREPSTPRTKNNRVFAPLQAVNTNESSSNDLMALSSRCIAELLQAEQRGKLALDLMEVSTPSFVSLTPTFFEPLLPAHATEHLQEAMHAALIKVMAERDEAHAQLVSASVLHAHSLEFEKKKVERLTAKLELASKLQQKNTRLFNLDKNKKAQEEIEEHEKLHKKHVEMQQNSDAEIVALCEQLSGEISSRTKAALEVIRMKESRKIERKHEAEEKDALKNELIRMKELLAKEQQKTQEAQREADKWKQYYEKVTAERKNKHEKDKN